MGPAVFLVEKKAHGSAMRMVTGGGSSVSVDPTRFTQLSWNRRRFLSEEECDHSISLVKDRLEKSMVADNDSGKSIESEVGISSGTFLLKAQDNIVAGIEARIAAWTFLPIEMGGETIFPNSEAKLSQPKTNDLSVCAKNGYSVKPKKGDALLFFNSHPDATTNMSSLHGSCPVIEGEKWPATKWIHVRNFDMPASSSTDRECKDKNMNCGTWAKAGECQKNPAYMVGFEDTYGYCRKSCKVCP